MANMVLNAEDIAFTKSNEGCPTNRAGLCVAYKDTHNPPVWTIGWGHTPAYEGETETQAVADSTFASDKASYIAGVNRNIHVPMTQHEFGAFCDFSFNIGVDGFATSTTCRKFNAGDKVGAGQGFFLWLIPADLYGRRVKELAYYNTPDSTAIKTATPAKNNANTTALQDAQKQAATKKASDALVAKNAASQKAKTDAINAQNALNKAKLTKNQVQIAAAQKAVDALKKVKPNTTTPINQNAKKVVLQSGIGFVGLLATILILRNGYDL